MAARILPSEEALIRSRLPLAVQDRHIAVVGSLRLIETLLREPYTESKARRLLGRVETHLRAEASRNWMERRSNSI